MVVCPLMTAPGSIGWFQLHIPQMALVKLNGSQNKTKSHEFGKEILGMCRGIWVGMGEREDNGIERKYITRMYEVAKEQKD